jgi:ferredoxin-type protein NapH
MKKALQIAIQVLFLALFTGLVILGKVQVWMAVFLIGGVLTSLLFSRIYCGWLCPINTLIKATAWVKKKLHIGSFKIPLFIKKPWIRYVFLGLFIALFAFSMISGKHIPVLPILVAIGVFISLLFPEELWHCYICPYGTILSLPASKAVKSLRINEEVCISCGKCKKSCQVNAVIQEDKTFSIDKKECLVCMACVEACSSDAIHLEKSKDSVNK